MLTSSISFDNNNSVYAIFQATSNDLARGGAFQTTIPENITTDNAGPSIWAKFDLNGIADGQHIMAFLFSLKANTNTYYGDAKAYMSESGANNHKCRCSIDGKF